MPGVSTAALEAALFATKDGAEKLKLQAAIQRRGGEDIREIARGQGNPYQTPSGTACAACTRAGWHA